MNSSDLARLELAKRAFQATQPRDAEVQAGVRRARLAIDRDAKPRRRWFSKGLVFVVLAVGSLAYAKPQALGELVEKVRPRETPDARQRLVGGPSSEPVSANATVAAKVTNGVEATVAAKATDNVEGSVAAKVTDNVEGSVAAKLTDEIDAATLKKATVSARATSTLSSRPAASAGRAPEGAVGASEGAASEPLAAVSDWGRVGQALARGDDTEALAALDGLSESEDQRTRDKADIGRAQLLMAHGNPDKACALARSLTHRRAGGRIERQAQLLLKSCGR